MKPFYENKDYTAQAYEADNMDFPEHLHEHIEILLVLEGSIRVRIMEKEQELAPGDCAVIFPQQIHSYHAIGESHTRLYIFDAALTGRYLHSIGKYSPAHPFLTAGELPQDAVFALDRLYALCGEGQGVPAEALFGRKSQRESMVLFSTPEDSDPEETMYREEAQDKEEDSGREEARDKEEDSGREEARNGKGSQDKEESRKREEQWAEGEKQSMSQEAGNQKELCVAWVQLLFALLWFRMAPEKRKRSERTELTCQVVQYVMEHFQEPLTLEVLARELHVNKYYISHTFSERLRVNFRRYLNHIRLEYAMQMMKTGNAPLADIWVEAGFNSQRSFNRAFLEIMGMTPGEYRNC